MKIEDIQNYKIDRSGWEAGPWDREPDRADFHHAGFACLMLRASSGNWCGYVGVPREHPAYGVNYNEVDVEVHGGLTYGRPCDGSHICHVPAPGEADDLWWLGFDCYHYGDIAPGSVAFCRKHGLPSLVDEGSAYRDARYVRNEVERLAEQLREKTSSSSFVTDPAPPPEAPR